MATLASRQMAIPIIIIELVGPAGQAAMRADREAFGNAQDKFTGMATLLGLDTTDQYNSASLGYKKENKSYQ